MFPLDLLALSAARRSATNVSSIALMIEHQLFPTAAAILRMQLDTFFRFGAAKLVDNPHELAIDVMKGVELRRLKDRNGHKMTDAHLVSAFSGEYPWISKVYRETCGYIHLSDKHFRNAMGGADAEAGKITLSVGATDEYVKDEDREEVLMACQEITEGFLILLDDWALVKDEK
jgi:hypothetical protein